MEGRKISNSKNANKSGFIFIPQKEEVLSGRFRLRYNACKNEYYIGTVDILNSNVKSFCTGWDSIVYTNEGTRRVIDATLEEVYLERTNEEENSRISWRFDFTSTGLVLDRLNMKINSEERGGGQITVNVSGDVGYKWVPYFSAGSFVTMASLGGSKTLTITANMIGENSSQVTRILNQSLQDENADYPFDIQIRLKRPAFTIGRSLIFLGLMYSTEAPTDPITNKNKKKQREQISAINKGYLHVHVQKAKRLPCRQNGKYAQSRVKCTLYGGYTQPCTVKTKALAKNLNPSWNEHLVIPHMTSEILEDSLLELQVTHSKTLFKRSQEVLGHIHLRQHQIFNSSSKKNESRYIPKRIFIEGDSMEQINPTVSVMSIARNSPKTDSIDDIRKNVSTVPSEHNNLQTCNGSITPKAESPVAPDDVIPSDGIISKLPIQEEKCHNDYSVDQDHDLVNITFRDPYYKDLLNEDNVKDDVNDDDNFEIVSSIEERVTTKQLNFINIRNNMGESETDHTNVNANADCNNNEQSNSQNENLSPISGNSIIQEANNSYFSKAKVQSSPKRRTVSVDNALLHSKTNFKDGSHPVATLSDSHETILLHERGSKSRSKQLQRSQSMSILSVNDPKKVNRPKNISVKLYRSGSVSNILEDDFFEDKVKKLSHKHWNIVINNPGQWFYCWHPLLGVKNVSQRQ